MDMRLEVVVIPVSDVDRAKAFYRRMGFTPTGARQPVRPDEPDHIEEQMILDLG